MVLTILQARKLAEEMFEQALRRKRLTGVHKNSAAYRDLRAGDRPALRPRKVSEQVVEA